MVVFDTSVLLLVLDPSTSPPLDPKTNAPLERAGQRIEHLIDTLSNERQTIIIPTPVISEIMVYAGSAGPKWLQYFTSTTAFRIAPFDQRAAIEAALLIRDSLDRGGVKVDLSDTAISRGKVNFDRQIVAVAKAEGAHSIYSDDGHIATIGNALGLPVHRTADLDLPPEDPQQKMKFEAE
jgi:predicted nucleic acid-binding protein